MPAAVKPAGEPITSTTKGAPTVPAKPVVATDASALSCAGCKKFPNLAAHSAHMTAPIENPHANTMPTTRRMLMVAVVADTVISVASTAVGNNVRQNSPEASWPGALFAFLFGRVGPGADGQFTKFARLWIEVVIFLNWQSEPRPKIHCWKADVFYFCI